MTRLLYHRAGSRLLVYYTHLVHVVGGLGEAVKSAVGDDRDILIHHLHVNEVPRSGEPDELLSKYGINSTAIVNAVKEVLKL